MLIDCSIPPVMSDPDLAKRTYEALEKEVEKGVRESMTRERAYPREVGEPQKSA